MLRHRYVQMRQKDVISMLKPKEDGIEMIREAPISFLLVKL